MSQYSEVIYIVKKCVKRSGISELVKSFFEKEFKSENASENVQNADENCEEEQGDEESVEGEESIDEEEGEEEIVQDPPRKRRRIDAPNFSADAEIIDPSNIDTLMR